MNTDFYYKEYVEDVVTGYKGYITAKCEYYDKKEIQYLVENIDTTGRPIEEWIEASRLMRTRD